MKSIPIFTFGSLILLALLLLGCSSSQRFSKVQSTPLLPRASSLPIAYHQGNPTVLRVAPIPIPITQNACGETLVEGEQADYSGVRVGVTTIEEMKVLLGEPDVNMYRGSVAEFIYTPRSDTSATTHVSIFTEAEIVTGISEDFSDALDDSPVPYYVKEIIADYGCPDLVFLLPFSEDGPAYLGAGLVYPQKGILFGVLGLPLWEFRTVTYREYFAPMTVDEFMQTRDDYLGGRARYATWAEASR